jgi:hypothetical protein
MILNAISCVDCFIVAFVAYLSSRENIAQTQAVQSGVSP